MGRSALTAEWEITGRSHDRGWRPATRSIVGCSDFWLKVFALSFGMGMVTGIVMAFSVRHQLERLGRAEPGQRGMLIDIGIM
jgi:bd-type cytochrome oxidase subunit I